MIFVSQASRFVLLCVWGRFYNRQFSRTAVYPCLLGTSFRISVHHNPGCPGPRPAQCGVCVMHTFSSPLRILDRVYCTCVYCHVTLQRVVMSLQQYRNRGLLSSQSGPWCPQARGRESWPLCVGVAKMPMGEDGIQPLTGSWEVQSLSRKRLFRTQRTQ